MKKNYKEINTPDLIYAAQTGDIDALNMLIEENIGLIKDIANRFWEKFNNGKFDIDDLIQEGRIGLWNAIMDFDFNQNCTLTTFAYKRIYRKIQYFISGIAPLTMSEKNFKKYLLFKQAREKLIESLGRNPSIKELMYQTGFDFEDVYAFEINCQELLYYQNVIGVDEVESDFDHIISPMYSTEDIVCIKSARWAIMESLKTLSQEEAWILINYFGLNGSIPMTDANIAKSLPTPCTREGARKKKMRILNRLRHTSVGLEEYY